MVSNEMCETGYLAQCPPTRPWERAAHFITNLCCFPVCVIGSCGYFPFDFVNGKRRFIVAATYILYMITSGNDCKKAMLHLYNTKRKKKRRVKLIAEFNSSLSKLLKYFIMI